MNNIKKQNALVKNTHELLANKKNFVLSKMQQNTAFNGPKTDLKISNADIQTGDQYFKSAQTPLSIANNTINLLKTDNRPNYEKLINEENEKQKTFVISQNPLGASVPSITGQPSVISGAADPIYQDRPTQKAMLSTDQLHMLELIGGLAALIYIFSRR